MTPTTDPPPSPPFLTTFTNEISSPPSSQLEQFNGVLNNREVDVHSLNVQGLQDPPPPYPSPRRSRRNRRHHAQQLSSGDSGYDVAPPQVLLFAQSFPVSDDANETTPLLVSSSPRSSARRVGRPRTLSHTSVRSSISAAPSLTQTVFSLFRPSPDSDIEYDPEQDGQQPESVAQEDATRILCTPADLRRPRWSLFSNRAWWRYFRVVTQRSYWAALFHLLVLNFPYALVAWVYLFVFTLTGTTLLMALPLGAVFCFLDLLGARAFARGELALQATFHSLSYPLPYPSRPIFTRLRQPTVVEVETSIPGPLYERSFYKNTYSMFTDSTSYQALFYFLVIKPSITLLLSLCIIIFVPVCMVLIFPAPAALRAVKRFGTWQANVAVEGLYMAVT